MLKLEQKFSVKIDEYNGIVDKDAFVEEVKHELKKALGEKLLEKMTEGSGWPYVMISDYEFEISRHSHRMYFTSSVCIEPMAPSLTFKAVAEHFETIKSKTLTEED